MKYTVFECFATWELCEEAIAAGFDTWIPVEHRYVPEKVNNKLTGAMLVKVSCAMSGYIFVPYDKWESFRDWAHTRYDPKLMMEYYGKASLSQPARRNLLKPKEVMSDELRVMDQILKDLWKAEQARYKAGGTPDQAKELALSSGDAILVAHGPFKGTEGKVISIKEKGVRVLLGAVYVTMPAAFLSLV